MTKSKKVVSHPPVDTQMIPGKTSFKSGNDEIPLYIFQG